MLPLLPVAALVGAALLPAPRTEARPRYAEAEEKPCAYCHANPAGGGERNYRGTFYGRNNTAEEFRTERKGMQGQGRSRRQGG